ncbi:hypothetical protein P9112_012998 [Eukaryota sp. TZLM1-RC]
MIIFALLLFICVAYGVPVEQHTVASPIFRQIVSGFKENAKMFSTFLRVSYRDPSALLSIPKMIHQGLAKLSETISSPISSSFFEFSHKLEENLVLAFPSVEAHAQIISHVLIGSILSVAFAMVLYTLFIVVRSVRVFPNFFSRLRLVLLSLALGYLIGRSQSKPLLLRSSNPMVFKYSILFLVLEFLLIRGIGTFLLSTPFLLILVSLVFDTDYHITSPRVMGLCVYYIAFYLVLGKVEQPLKKRRVKQQILPNEAANTTKPKVNVSTDVEDESNQEKVKNKGKDKKQKQNQSNNVTTTSSPKKRKNKSKK